MLPYHRTNRSGCASIDFGIMWLFKSTFRSCLFIFVLLSWSISIFGNKWAIIIWRKRCVENKTKYQEQKPTHRAFRMCIVVWIDHLFNNSAVFLHERKKNYENEDEGKKTKMKRKKHVSEQRQKSHHSTQPKDGICVYVAFVFSKHLIQKWSSNLCVYTVIHSLIPHAKHQA